MAIEPIKGFYVHDEATDTDGVANLEMSATVGLYETVGEVEYTTADGYFGTSGEIYSPSATSQEVYSTDFIPVTEGMKMTLNLKYSERVAVWACFVGYDAGRNGLGRVVVVNSTTDNATGIYEVPANCRSVRVSYRTYGKLESATLAYGGISEFLHSNFLGIVGTGEVEKVSAYDIGKNRQDIFGKPSNRMLASWFEHGNLDSSGQNQDYRNGSRIRTKDILSFPYPTVLKANGAQFIIFYFQNGTFVNASSWRNSNDAPVFLNANQQFRLLVTKNNSAPSTQYDTVDSVVELLVLYADPPLRVNIKDGTAIAFERGHLEVETGEITAYNAGTRVHSNMAKLPYSLKVTMLTGGVVVACYDDNGTYLWKTAWRENNPYIIPAGYNFRLLLALPVGSNTPTSTADILDQLKLEPLDNAIGNVSPNIIYQCRNVNDSIFPPYSKYYIHAAAKNQYDRVRFNVRKTTDGYYFLCHDATINNVARNPDGSEISGDVSATGKTLAELNAYDWGIKYGAKYAGMDVPLLEDALKYSALFNLGVTLETYAVSDTEIQETLALCDKYGVTDNLIVIDVVGTQIAKLKQFVDYNPRVSAYVGAEESWYTSENVERVKTLQTPYNKVYVQLYPWGTMPSDDFIALAKENNFVLYNSITMNESALLNENVFNKGYGLIEVNNVFCIKDTIRQWVNGLVDNGES